VEENDEESEYATSKTPSVAATITAISSLIQSTLISAQSICDVEQSKETAEEPNFDEGESNDDSLSLFQSHKQMINEWGSLNQDRMIDCLEALSESLIRLHEDKSSNAYSRSLCTRATVNTFSLADKIQEICKSRIRDALAFYQNHSKFLYILLRVFRNLVAKGFCSDDVSDGAEGDGEGGAGEMKFEDDVEGTGMGEGDGKNDVTDQIENEEQLLGLKGDENQEASSKQERQELKEDEVDTGMEMENDFEGEKFDLPDQPDDQNKDDDNKEDDEEELDREMGDGEDPNEQVVDEKMWDKDEDDLDELNQDQEKFEENSKMAGDQLDDEMRTKDDQEDGEDNTAKDGGDEHKPNQPEKEENKVEDSQGENADKDEKIPDELINDDTEDKYEDKHDGVDVRNENAEEEDGEEELGIDLNDGLNLDDEGEDGNSDNASEEDDGGNDLDNTINEDADTEENGDDNDDLMTGEADPEEDNEEDEDMRDPDRMEPVGQGGAGDEEQQDEPEAADEEDENAKVEQPPPKSNYESNEQLHGVAASDGQDQVKEKEETPEDEDVDEGMADENNTGGADEEPTGQSSQGDGGSGSDGNWQKGRDEEQNGTNQSEPHNEVPNPFRSPGDAEKFWHKRLDIIQDSQRDEETTVSDERMNEEETKNKDGQFEYTMEGEENTGQVLGVAEEEQAMQLNEGEDDGIEPQNQEEQTNMDTDDIEAKRAQSNSSRSNSEPKQSNDNMEEKREEPAEVSEMETHTEAEEDEDLIEESNAVIKAKSTSAKTRSVDEASDDEDHEVGSDDEIVEMDVSTGMTLDDIQQARLYWQTIQSETNNLSRRLCEKLRLVMEPLVATKLRGDYRTGKRVNMKRIIGYIASGYRKDKIWLRRTKPAKRDYRVLIAVDDSESMQNGQAGDMALRALATLANGMSQLEIGQLGVASFGEDMKLIHPFNLPFTSESGVNVASNFSFKAKRTRTALCIESSIAALDNANSSSSSMQLVFMISDGRIERDSRSKVRRLIRQMSEKNMLMVMIIVEGDAAENKKKNESILNMKEVSFVNGKPKIKHFIEDYPFPYYLVVEDLAALPEVLGDALRQWFEMLAQIQSSG
jgi:midasin